MRIALRVDASTVMGSGHVMRCVTLAEALRQRGDEVLFVSRQHPGHLCDLIAGKGLPVATLPVPAEAMPRLPASESPCHAEWIGAPWKVDAEQTRAALQPGAMWDWLVVDHYGIDERWERALRPQARAIFVIDDLDDRPHDADLILDQGFQGPDGSRHARSAGSQTTLLLGPRYALLRGEFAAARSTLRERNGRLERVLVYFGAYDMAGQTLKTVRALQRSSLSGLRVDVVMGSAAPERKSVEAACRGLDHAVHATPVDMAQMMAEADLAIGGAGTTTWERCCLGLPSLVIGVAHNQHETAESLAEDGSCVYLGSADEVTERQIADTVCALAANQRWLRLLARRCHRLVDGAGTHRVLGHLSPREVKLRPATQQDAVPMFHWRNVPENRRFAFDPAPLELASHLAWVDAVLGAADRVLLVAECAGKPVGVLRYDVSDKTARVSIYLVPGSHGQGLGAEILAAGSRWVREHRGSVEELVAEIKPANIASIHAFERAGYVPASNVYRQSLRKQQRQE